MPLCSLMPLAYCCSTGHKWLWDKMVEFTVSRGAGSISSNLISRRSVLKCWTASSGASQHPKTTNYFSRLPGWLTGNKRTAYLKIRQQSIPDGVAAMYYFQWADEKFASRAPGWILNWHGKAWENYRVWRVLSPAAWISQAQANNPTCILYWHCTANHSVLWLSQQLHPTSPIPAGPLRSFISHVLLEPVQKAKEDLSASEDHYYTDHHREV